MAFKFQAIPGANGEPTAVAVGDRQIVPGEVHTHGDSIRCLVCGECDHSQKEFCGECGHLPITFPTPTRFTEAEFDAYCESLLKR